MSFYGAVGLTATRLACPDPSGGLLSATEKAGALFPQPVSAEGARLDDLLGFTPAMIGRSLPDQARSEVRMLDLGLPALAPFATVLEKWLQEQGAAAVPIRPDRHIFATGEAARLLELWRASIETRIAA